MSIARFYEEAKNPDGATLPGVPLADLTEEFYDAQPAHIQRSIDAVGFYRKTKPRAESTPRREPVRPAPAGEYSGGHRKIEDDDEPSGDAGEKEG
jgi:hypothetical protein